MNGIEQIESEIGMKITDLYRALKQGYIYYRFHIGADKWRTERIEIRGLQLNKYDSSVYVSNSKGTLHVLSGYGKTWACTMEELP